MDIIKVDEKKLDAVLNNSLISCQGISANYFRDKSCQEYSTEDKAISCPLCCLKNKQSIKKWLKESAEEGESNGK